MKRALPQIQIFNDFVLFVILSINEQLSRCEQCYCDTSLTFLVCSEKDNKSEILLRPILILVLHTHIARTI